MREVHLAALKHGVSEDDIKHALRHPMRVIHKDDDTHLYLGSGKNAELLEVMTISGPEGSEIAVHAMKMRSKYENLIPRE
jgi:hypothetical protein